MTNVRRTCYFMFARAEAARRLRGCAALRSPLTILRQVETPSQVVAAPSEGGGRPVRLARPLFKRSERKRMEKGAQPGKLGGSFGGPHVESGAADIALTCSNKNEHDLVVAPLAPDAFQPRHPGRAHPMSSRRRRGRRRPPLHNAPSYRPAKRCTAHQQLTSREGRARRPN